LRFLRAELPPFSPRPSAEFLVLRPADVTRRNGTLLYEVNNRGNIAIFRQLNEAPSNNDPATTADAANWFLLRHGFTLVWSAWAPASSSLPLRAQDDAGSPVRPVAIGAFRVLS
jgi:hypothetical protein